MRKMISLASLLFLAVGVQAQDQIEGTLSVETSDLSKATLHVSLTDQVEYVAFQMDVTLPTGWTVTGATPVGTERTPNFKLGYNVTNNNEVVILGYNLTNQAIQGNTGEEIFSIELTKSSESSNATPAFWNATFSNVKFVKASEPAVAGDLDVSNNSHADLALSLVDGYSFTAPTTIQAGEVTYSREVSNNWGTLVLPYAISSSEAVQLYNLSEVIIDGDKGKMTFAPATAIEANTPCVFKKLQGAGISFTAEDAEISTPEAPASATVTNWTMNGTYSNLTLDPTDKNAYFIASDKFWKADTSIDLKAFRGWFETSDNLGATRFSISDANETDDIELIENQDGSVDILFDLQGRQLSDLQPGINIINGKKVIVK